jgi:hypothetical protein
VDAAEGALDLELHRSVQLAVTTLCMAAARSSTKLCDTALACTDLPTMTSKFTVPRSAARTARRLSIQTPPGSRSTGHNCVPY